MKHKRNPGKWSSSGSGRQRRGGRGEKSGKDQKVRLHRPFQEHDKGTDFRLRAVEHSMITEKGEKGGITDRTERFHEGQVYGLIGWARRVTCPVYHSNSPCPL